MIGLLALVRLSALIRCNACGSRSGAVAVPHTAELPAAAFAEPVAAWELACVRSVSGSRSALVDGPLITASGSTASTAGSWRRLAASAAETVVATAFSVR